MGNIGARLCVVIAQLIAIEIAFVGACYGQSQNLLCDSTIQLAIWGPYHYDPDSAYFCHRKSAPILRDTVACANECEECCLYYLFITPHWKIGDPHEHDRITRFSMCTDWGGCKQGSSYARPCTEIDPRGCIPHWNHICEFCDPHSVDYNNKDHVWKEVCMNVLDTIISCAYDTTIIPPQFPTEPPDTIITKACDTGLVSHLCQYNCLHLSAVDSSGWLYTKQTFFMRFGLTGDCRDTGRKCVWIRFYIRDQFGAERVQDCRFTLPSCSTDSTPPFYVPPCDSASIRRGHDPQGLSWLSGLKGGAGHADNDVKPSSESEMKHLDTESIDRERPDTQESQQVSGTLVFSRADDRTHRDRPHSLNSNREMER